MNLAKILKFIFQEVGGKSLDSFLNSISWMSDVHLNLFVEEQLENPPDIYVENENPSHCSSLWWVE